MEYDCATTVDINIAGYRTRGGTLEVFQRQPFRVPWHASSTLQQRAYGRDVLPGSTQERRMWFPTSVVDLVLHRFRSCSKFVRVFSWRNLRKFKDSLRKVQHQHNRNSAEAPPVQRREQMRSVWCRLALSCSQENPRYAVRYHGSCPRCASCSMCLSGMKTHD